MMKVRNGFIRNLHYLCLIGVVALGLMTIVGTGGGGGGGTSVSTDTGDTDQTDTDTGDGEETAAPAFSEFDFTLGEGDFWEYKWDYTKSYWDSFSGGSTSTGSGTFRVTLRSAKEIDGVTAYEVEVSGKSTVSTHDFAPRWNYLAVANNQILGSEDGATLVVLFDAQEGVWPGSGFFTTFASDTLFAATEGQINNDYLSGPAITVGQSESESQCEYFPGVGTICGGDYNENLIKREYYGENIGPMGYYSYTSISDMTSSYPWSSSTTINVGLVASSLRGDTVDYELEAEPNDAPGTAQSANLSVDMEGHCGDEDGGTLMTLNETAEVEPNDHPQQSTQTLDQPTIINGDIQDDDTFTAIDFDYGDSNWPRAVEDWYTFSLTSATTVNVELNHEGQLSTEIQLYLFNDTGTTSMGNVVTFDEQTDPTTTTRSITHALNAGTYLIAVDAWDTYAVRVDYTLDFLDGEREVEDFYSFILNDQTTVTITLDIGDSTADLDLYLYDEGAITLLGSSSAGGDQESITTTLDSGTYMVGVDAFNGSSSYTLTIQ